MMANSFVDWMEGGTEEEIATRPRRFVCFHKNNTNVPEHLKYFIGRGYTDEHGEPEHEKKEKRPR